MIQMFQQEVRLDKTLNGIMLKLTHTIFVVPDNNFIKCPPLPWLITNVATLIIFQFSHYFTWTCQEMKS